LIIIFLQEAFRKALNVLWNFTAINALEFIPISLVWISILFRLWNNLFFPHLRRGYVHMTSFGKYNFIVYEVIDEIIVIIFARCVAM
jgi:hypothetical protein